MTKRGGSELIGNFAVPAFTHGTMEGDSGTSGQETWQALHKVCEEVHEGLGYAPCHGYKYPASEEGPNTCSGMMGGHMSSWSGIVGW